MTPLPSSEWADDPATWQQAVNETCHHLFLPAYLRLSLVDFVILGEAKIGNFAHFIMTHQDVTGSQISVDDLKEKVSCIALGKGWTRHLHRAHVPP